MIIINERKKKKIAKNLYFLKKSSIALNFYLVEIFRRKNKPELDENEYI